MQISIDIFVRVPVCVSVHVFVSESLSQSVCLLIRIPTSVPPLLRIPHNHRRRYHKCRCRLTLSLVQFR